VLFEIVWPDDRLRSLLDRRAVGNRRRDCVSFVFPRVSLHFSSLRPSADSWFSLICGGLAF
jgi:hypothetical protein